MASKRRRFIPLLCAILIVAGGGTYLYLTLTTASSATGYTPGAAPASHGPVRMPPATFGNNKDARAKYDRMLEALAAAQSLYYQTDYAFGRLGQGPGQTARYAIWLRKPNFVRVEASSILPNNPQQGVLVGDGANFWIYWPTGRPRWHTEEVSGQMSEYEKTRFSSYIKRPAPPGAHSIGFEVSNLGFGARLVMDPSIFLGAGGPMQRILMGAVRLVGAETVAGEECDVVETRTADGGLSQTIWISKNDHLPRKLEEIQRIDPERLWMKSLLDSRWLPQRLKRVVRYSYVLYAQEQWSNVTVNAQVADDRFKWSPPEGWAEYVFPDVKTLLLKPGDPAPDFSLASAAGGAPIRFSNYRGKAVWMYFWRAPGDGLSRLEEIHKSFAAKGLVALGLNTHDANKLARDVLKSKSVSMPTVVDSSTEALTMLTGAYKVMISGPSANYIIDRDGKIVDAWYGDNWGRGLADIEQLGIK